MKLYTTTPPVSLELELRFIQIIILHFSIINLLTFLINILLFQYIYLTGIV